MSGSLTRVSVLGATHHVDVVVPSDEPLAGLMSQIFDLVQEPVEFQSIPLVLTNDLGIPFSKDKSLAELGVLDGAILRLRAIDDAPPDAVVFDVSATTGEQTQTRRWQWTGVWRRAVLAVVFGILLAGAVILAAASIDTGWSVWLLLILAIALLLSGVLAARVLSQTSLGYGLVVAAAVSSGVGLCLLPFGGPVRLPNTAVSWLPADSQVLITIGIFGGLLTCIFLGLAWISSAWTLFTSGAVSTALLSALFAVTFVFGHDLAVSAGIVSIVALIGLGSSARLATQVSGLAGLDDDQRMGVAIRHDSTERAVMRAHQTMAIFSTICAVFAGLTIIVICTQTGRDVWSLPFVFVILGVLVLRTQSMPLVVERAIGYGSAVVATVMATLIVAGRYPSLWLALLLFVFAVFVACGIVINTREATAARLRVTARRVETVLILASIPLLLGLSGLFAQLVTSFG